MLKRLLVLALFTSVLATAVALYSHRGVTQTIDPATLAGIAMQAQAQGRSEVNIGRDIMYDGVDDLNSAISRYTIIDAVAIAKQSYVLDEFNIGTWYKFRLNYTIKQNPLVVCAQCSSNIPDPPAELLPLNSNEVLILHPAGSQLVNGTTINVMVSDFPDFNLDQRYLLFLDFDSAKAVGTVSLGPPGVYVVDANGGLIPVYDADPEDIVVSGLTATYGNNANTLRNALNPQPPSTCNPVQEQNCYDLDGMWNSTTCHCTIPPNPCAHKPWLCE